MGSAKPQSRIFSGDFHTRPKKLSFFQPFLRFFLAFCDYLGYSPLRPEFFGENLGSQLAACFDRIGVERKNRRISRLDGSQATEQDQGCGTHRRESRHTEENRRSLL